MGSGTDDADHPGGFYRQRRKIAEVDHVAHHMLQDVEARTIAKVTSRLVPFLVVCYVRPITGGERATILHSNAQSLIETIRPREPFFPPVENATRLLRLPGICCWIIAPLS